MNLYKFHANPQELKHYDEIGKNLDEFGNRLEWHDHPHHSLLHRENDLPAVIFADGTKVWWRDGKIHRDGDKPAWIQPNGPTQWFKNGRLHRDGAPASIPAPDDEYGAEEWYQDGTPHRDDGPAIISKLGAKAWWKDGVCVQDLSNDGKLWQRYPNRPVLK